MIVTTVEEQKRVARAARAVGGYSALVRLEQQRQWFVEQGKPHRLDRADGTYRYVELTQEEIDARRAEEDSHKALSARTPFWMRVRRLLQRRLHPLPEGLSDRS